MDNNYKDGFSFPQSVLNDVERMKNLFHKKWFFVGTRGDVPNPGNYFTLVLFYYSWFRW